MPEGKKTPEVPFPAVPQTLLRRLEEMFPDRLPKETPSIEEAARLVGQQQVIRKLRHHFDEQQKNILTSN